MAKRFTATEIWGEDWFLEMPNEYKLFWYYMLSNCDYAGIFKVNVRSFSGLLEVSLSSTTALEHFNLGKNRIRVLSDSIWFIEDFFVYQYGMIFNYKNNMHDSIGKIYKKHEIDLTSLRGLREVRGTPKEKDKDSINVLTVKTTENGKTENGFSSVFKARGEEVLIKRHAENLAAQERNRQKDSEGEV